MQEKKTSLRCDGDDDFIRQLQTSATFEAFLRKKHLNVSKQFSLVGRRKPAKKRHVAIDSV